MELFLTVLPICVSALSATTTFVKSSLKEHDELRKQWERLKVDLSKLSKELKQIALKKPDLVHDLQVVVDKTVTLLSKKSLPPKGKIWEWLGNKDKTEFLKLLEELEAQIKSTLLLICFKTFEEMGITRDQLAELIIKLDLSIDKLNDLQDGVTRIEDKLDRALNGNGHDNGRIWVLPEDIRSALAVLENAGSHSNDEKNNAKETLLKWLEGPTGQQDALKVALIFARDGSDDVKSVGLDILVQMSEDDEQRERLFASGEALEVLLAVPRGEATDAVTQRASRCLTNLVTEEPATFFDKWEKMEKMDDSRCAIVDEDLMKQIVATVIASIDPLLPKEEKSEDQALRVLAKLAEIGVCKPVVARAGGIAALSTVYNATEKMTNDEFEAAISSSVLLAIDALASLSVDDTCRAAFAEKEANIQPLVHFVWSCSALSTEDLQYVTKVELPFGNVDESEDYGPVLTPFGHNRITKRVWQSENAASRALCELLGDNRCREAVMKLGTFIDPMSGKPLRDPHTRDQSLQPRKCLPGWLAVANQVVKGMEDIKRAVQWDGSRNYSWIPEVQDKEVWPKDRVALGPDLLRAVWHFVNDGKIKSGMQTIRNLMNGASRTTVLGFFLRCGQNKLLNYDELLDPSVAIKSKRAIRWATEYEDLKTDDRAEEVAEYFWAACVLMNALTLERPSGRRSRRYLVNLAAEMNEELLEQKNPNGDEYDRELFVPLVEHWVFKTKRSDMNEDCIRFLGIGASWFTSTTYDSDEDDDSSSEDDESEDKSSVSEDKSSVSADDSGSDTSKHSGSNRESAVDERGPRQECLVRLAKLWPDYEDIIRKECSKEVVREVHTLLPADANIKLTLHPNANNDPRSFPVKCKGNDTMGHLKKLVAEELDTLQENIMIRRGQKTISKDHITLEEYGIQDCSELLYGTRV